MEALQKTILLWVNDWISTDYQTPVPNLHTCFKNGLIFCYIIHKFDITLFDWKKLSEKNARENIELAIDSAYRKLSIPKLIRPEDIMNYEKPDEFVISAYLSLIYKEYLKNYKNRDVSLLMLHLYDEKNDVDDNEIMSEKKEKITVIEEVAVIGEEVKKKKKEKGKDKDKDVTTKDNKRNPKIKLRKKQGTRISRKLKELKERYQNRKLTSPKHSPPVNNKNNSNMKRKSSTEKIVNNQKKITNGNVNQVKKRQSSGREIKKVREVKKNPAPPSYKAKPPLGRKKPPLGRNSGRGRGRNSSRGRGRSSGRGRGRNSSRGRGRSSGRGRGGRNNSNLKIMQKKKQEARKVNVRNRYSARSNQMKSPRIRNLQSKLVSCHSNGNKNNKKNNRNNKKPSPNSKMRRRVKSTPPIRLAKLGGEQINKDIKFLINKYKDSKNRIKIREVGLYYSLLKDKEWDKQTHGTITTYIKKNKDIFNFHQVSPGKHEVSIV